MRDLLTIANVVLKALYPDQYGQKIDAHAGLILMGRRQLIQNVLRDADNGVLISTLAGQIACQLYSHPPQQAEAAPKIAAALQAYHDAKLKENNFGE